MNREFRERQSDIIDFDLLTRPMTLIGAGGIGSWTALSLCKLGATSLTVWDMDKVEAVNVGNQLYGEQDIGKPKPEALAVHIKELTGIDIKPVCKAWDNQPLTDNIIISGLDNMAIRAKLAAHLSVIKPGLYIDGRMLADMIRIVTATPETWEKYFKTLVTDDQLEHVPCTAKAVSYNTMIVSGLITSIVKLYLTGQPYPRELIVDLTTHYVEVVKHNDDKQAQISVICDNPMVSQS